MPGYNQLCVLQTMWDGVSIWISGLHFQAFNILLIPLFAQNMRQPDEMTTSLAAQEYGYTFDKVSASETPLSSMASSMVPGSEDRMPSI